MVKQISMSEGLCWNCHSKIDDRAAICKNCSKILPFPEGIDYFQCLGLRRKLGVNLQDLEARFYKLSRQFHPDFHQGKDETEKNISLANSASLNKAYRTLQDPFSRVEYLIHLEEGTKDTIAAKIPQEFLEEIFELQETLEEFRSAEDPDILQKLRVSLQEALRMLESRLLDLSKRLFDLFGRWDEMIDSSDHLPSSEERTPLIRPMREILSYRTYFTNMIQDIQHLLQGNKERRQIRH
jgi:molecular chaperone HscB